MTVSECQFRIGAECLFKPTDRLVGARFQQIHGPDQHVPIGNEGIARAEADSLLDERCGLLDRSNQQLAHAESVENIYQLRLDAITVSYSGIACSGSPRACRSIPLARCTSGRRGDATKARLTSTSAR